MLNDVLAVSVAVAVVGVLATILGAVELTSKVLHAVRRAKRKAPNSVVLRGRDGDLDSGRRRLNPRTLVALPLALLFIGAGSLTGAAQTAIEGKLIGKWEGEVRTKVRGAVDQDRTLLIQSLSRHNGRLTAEALYGSTGKRLRPVTIEVTTDADGQQLHFRSDANDPIVLNVINDKTLLGTIRFPTLSTTRGSGDRDIRLDKVE